jgi:hypothetical protein
MYIRWVVRKHKNSATANVTFHDAYLVESYRDDRNDPRQRTICYLGNIRQIDDEFPPIERELFFLRAERILAGEREVPPEERPQILQLLRQKVPELTAEEVQIAFRNTVRWFYARWASDGASPSREELMRFLDSAAERMGPI